MQTKLDYEKAFRYLAHIKALKAEENIDAIVQGLICVALSTRQSSSEGPKSHQEVANLVLEETGVSIQLKHIISNVDKLQNKGDIFLNSIPDKHYRLSKDAQISVNRQSDSFEQLESSLRHDWIENVRKKNEIFNAIKPNELWNCLQVFLCKVFEAHGVRTIDLLSSFAWQREDSTDNYYKQLDTYVDQIHESYLECLPGVTKDHLNDAFIDFVASESEEVSKYLIRILDTTLTAYALSNKVEFQREAIASKTSDLIILLDTNFMFGILGLHNNIQDAAALEIKKEVNYSHLPIQLNYLSATLEEFSYTINGISNRFKTKWTPEQSSSLIEDDQFETAFEKEYHLLNLEHDISHKDFMAKYEDIEIILRHEGFHKLREDDSNFGFLHYSSNYSSKNSNEEKYYVDIESLVEEYRDALEKNHKVKNDFSLLHDAKLLLFAAKKNKFQKNETMYLNMIALF